MTSTTSPSHQETNSGQESPSQGDHQTQDMNQSEEEERLMMDSSMNPTQEQEEDCNEETTVINGLVNKSESNSNNNQSERKESSSSAMSPPVIVSSNSPESIAVETTVQETNNHWNATNHTSPSKARPLRLRRVNHSSELLSGLKDLLANESLTDVILSCQGGVNIKAHRVILSTFSPYFKSVFEGHPFSENPWTFPVVVLKDYGVNEVKAIVDFIYKGEVSVSRERLPLVLETARGLQVNGLSSLDHPLDHRSDQQTGSPVKETIKDIGINGHVSKQRESPNNNSLNALRSLHGLSSQPLPLKRSLESPLDSHEDDASINSMMAKRLRNCLQDNRREESHHALNLSNNSNNRNSPIQQQPEYSRLPASILGQLVQHQMLQQKKMISEQQMKHNISNNQLNQRIGLNSNHSVNHSVNQTNLHLKQQILQQQLLRSKTSTPTAVTSPVTVNTNRLNNGNNNYSLTQQFQARLRQQMQERHALNNPLNYKREDSNQMPMNQQNQHNSIQDEDCEDEDNIDEQESTKESIFHRQQQLRLQQLQKQQHQYALQMQIQEESKYESDDDHQNDGSGSVDNNHENTDNHDNDSNGFDWQEGFTDDSIDSRQLQIANINSNCNGGSNSIKSGVSTPDFLQPRGPGRPRKGNKAQEISPCPECNKVFVRPDVLKLHYRSVHLNERHPCNLCPKIFKWPGDLSKHKRTKHPDKYPPISAQ
jgi:hypothetical protein